MPIKLIVGQRRVDLAFDKNTPGIVVVNDDVGQATALRLLLAGRHLARKRLLDDVKAVGLDRTCRTNPVNEVTKKTTVFIQAHGERVTETVLWLGILVK